MAYPLADLAAAFLARRYYFKDHALEQMLERQISVEEIERALGEDAPEVLEESSDDLRGPECLVLGWTPGGRPLHIKIGYAHYRYPDVITVYEPDPAEWIEFRRRRSESHA